MYIVILYTNITTIPAGIVPKNRNLNLSSQEGYRFVQISPGNREGGTSLIISVSLNVKKEIIGLARQHTAMGFWGGLPVT
jgi:hypothetical protein